MIDEEYHRMEKLEEYHWWFVAKRNFVKSLLPKSKEFKILDIGSGTGGTTKFMEKYGDVIGLEKNPIGIRLARKRGLKVVDGDAQKLPFKNSSFDMVTIFDVLYHQDVKNDTRAIRETYRVLESGGKLVITDSALDFLRSSHDKAVYTRHRYYKGELIEKLKKTGFEIEKASYIFFFVFPLFLVSRVVGKFFKKEDSDLKRVPKTLNNLLIYICGFEAKILQYINLPIGSSLILIAKKP